MALQGEVTRDEGSLGASILDGAALVVVSPIVVPALVLGLRPVAKTFIKGSLFVTDTVKWLAVAISDGWSDLVAEARSQEQPAAPETADTRVASPHQANGASLRGTTRTASAVEDTGAEPPQQADAADLLNI